MTLADCLKLTAFFGDADRVGGRFLADRLCDTYERRGIRTSVLVRGTDGFGVKHRLRMDRALTRSQDLPLVSIAIDRAERIEATLDELKTMWPHGLITLERAGLVSPYPASYDPAARGKDESMKLTVYCGRGERVHGSPADIGMIGALRRRDFTAAIVLVGIDGTARGTRTRARFLARNQSVPLMAVGVGKRSEVAGVVSDLAEHLTSPTITLERIQTLKRDGRRVSALPKLASADGRGLNLWQKLTVYTSERARYRNRPLHGELLRRLRAAGAAGATVLRGVRGYHGSYAWSGEHLFSLRRQGPVITVLVDWPERMPRWFEIVDELTQATGLVTSEVVPAFKAMGPDIAEGGLRLAQTQAALL